MKFEWIKIPDKFFHENTMQNIGHFHILFGPQWHSMLIHLLFIWTGNCLRWRGFSICLTTSVGTIINTQNKNKTCWRHVNHVYAKWKLFFSTLRWRHNGRNSVSNHQPRRCILNRLSRRRSNKTSKLRVTGLCAGNSPETGEVPAQRASNAENVSIWWRHHALPEVHHMCQDIDKLDTQAGIVLVSFRRSCHVRLVLKGNKHLWSHNGFKSWLLPMTYEIDYYFPNITSKYVPRT